MIVLIWIEHLLEKIQIHPQAAIEFQHLIIVKMHEGIIKTIDKYTY